LGAVLVKVASRESGDTFSCTAWQPIRASVARLTALAEKMEDFFMVSSSRVKNQGQGIRADSLGYLMSSANYMPTKFSLSLCQNSTSSEGIDDLTPELASPVCVSCHHKKVTPVTVL
jgi:hypothetical protein